MIIEKPEYASYPGDTLTYGEEGKCGKNPVERKRESRSSILWYAFNPRKKKKGKKKDGGEKEIHRESTFRENDFRGEGVRQVQKARVLFTLTWGGLGERKKGGKREEKNSTRAIKG